MSRNPVCWLLGHKWGRVSDRDRPHVIASWCKRCGYGRRLGDGKTFIMDWEPLPGVKPEQVTYSKSWKVER